MNAGIGEIPFTGTKQQQKPSKRFIKTGQVLYFLNTLSTTTAVETADNKQSSNASAIAKQQDAPKATVHWIHRAYCFSQNCTSKHCRAGRSHE